jgi:phage shock protein A
MFTEKLNAKYRVMSGPSHMLEKIINGAKDELDKVDKELMDARNEYAALVKKSDDTDNTSLEDLERMEEKIEELEEEHEQASDNYEKAMTTTIDDLKADHHYEDWKASR